LVLIKRILLVISTAILVLASPVKAQDIRQGNSSLRTSIQMSDINTENTEARTLMLVKKAFLLQKLHKLDQYDSERDEYRQLIDISIGRTPVPKKVELNKLIVTLMGTDDVSAKAFTDFFEVHSIRDDKIYNMESYKRLSVSNKNFEREGYFLRRLLLSIIHLKRQDVYIGLETANEALEAIQLESNQSDYAQLYDVYSVINNGFILDKSFEQALHTTSKILSHADQAQLPPDAFSISNNLAVLYAYRNDFDTALIIMEAIEKNLNYARDDQKVAFYYSMGRFLNHEKQYQRARKYIKAGLEANPADRYIPHLYAALAISYSESGSLYEAKQLLKKIEGGTEYPGMEISTLRLKHTLFAKDGKYQDAYEYIKKYIERVEEKLNEEVMSSRQEMALKISVSARVQEQKLANLESEGLLKDKIIEREKKLRFLSILVIVLLMVMLLLLLFGIIRLRRNNTEIRKARDLAVAGEKAKTEFLGMMSHELRTPLNAIIPLSDCLMSKTKDHQDYKLLNLIRNAGESLLLLLENIMLMSSDEEYDEKYYIDVDIHDVVNNALEAMQTDINKKNLKVQIGRARNSTSTIILTHNRLIKAIVNNIISNAVKFTDSGTVSIILGGNAEEFILRISDTGEGMDMKLMPRLLKPFEQTDNSMRRRVAGAGIGLSTSYRCVNNLGGVMKIKSDIGVGTVVEIKLPVAISTGEKLAA